MRARGGRAARARPQRLGEERRNDGADGALRGRQSSAEWCAAMAGTGTGEPSDHGTAAGVLGPVARAPRRRRSGVDMWRGCVGA